MSTLHKIFVVIITVAAIMASVVFIQHANTAENWRQAADNQALLAAEAQAKFQETEDKLAQLQTRFDNYRRNAATQQAALEGEIEQMSVDLIRQETANAGYQRDLTVYTGELTALRGAVEEQNRLREEILAQLDEARSDVVRLQTQVRQSNAASRDLQLSLEQAQHAVRSLREQLADKDDQLADLREQLARGAGGATGSERAVTVQPTIIGTVQQIRGQLAELNVGSADGVSAGMEFTVYRGADYVATLVIEEVAAEASAGTLQNRRMAVQVGDRAATELAVLDGGQ